MNTLYIRKRFKIFEKIKIEGINWIKINLINKLIIKIIKKFIYINPSSTFKFGAILKVFRRAYLTSVSWVTNYVS